MCNAEGEANDEDAMIAVSVCTYKRPSGLQRLLDAFTELRLPEPVCFIIVDNDGNDPIISFIIKQFTEKIPAHVELVVEREPGISAARNAAFAAARRSGATWLAMLDDDEWPPAHWLEALVSRAAATDAKVIGGPVRPVFPADRPDLARHARFWSVEREYLGDKPFVFCTCNFLIELAATDPLGDQPFDPEFGITGGGDTVFFRSLYNLGVPMDWSEEAWISEEIPASRASVKWLRQRRYRAGNVAYRWEGEFAVAGDIDRRVKNLLLLAALPFYPLRSREKSDRMLAWRLEFEKVAGRFAAQFGRDYAEYSRPPSPDKEAPEKACR